MRFGNLPITHPASGGVTYMHHSSWLSTWVWGIQTQILTLAQWIQLSSLLGLTALKITNLFKISPSSLKAFVWVWPPISL